METVDGADVGEDPLNNITREGRARASLLQESGAENLPAEEHRSHTEQEQTEER